MRAMDGRARTGFRQDRMGRIPCGVDRHHPVEWSGVQPVRTGSRRGNSWQLLSPGTHDLPIP